MPRADLDKRPQEVAAMFDEVADRYDLTNDLLALGQTRLWRRAVVNAIRPQPGERILDLAAGTGTSSAPMAARGATVVPCDFSLGMLRVGRRREPSLPFVAVERARASALLRLVEAVASAPAGTGGFGWVERLGDGTRVTIRLARPEDAEAVAEMHSRSSEQTRYQRYFAPISEWRGDQLRRLAGGHRGATLVAQDARGNIVGLGNVFPDRPGDTVAAEIAVIVEDAWQGRGLGSRLLAHLIELARRQGYAEVVALVLADNSRMLALLERLPLSWNLGDDPDLGASIVRLCAPLV